MGSFGDKYDLYLKTIDLYGEYTTTKLRSETLKAITAHQAIQYIFDYMIEVWVIIGSCGNIKYKDILIGE